MNFLKTASEFEGILQRSASQELIASLFPERDEEIAEEESSSNGSTDEGGDKTSLCNKDNEEGKIMNKTAGVEVNKFKVSGVNSSEQDDFEQVQGVVGFKNSEVKEAMGKVASTIRTVEEIKRTATKEGTMTKYASLIESLEGEIRVAAELCRKALKENPDSCLNMNKEPTNDKPYGAYDKSEPAITHETQSDHTDWKNDKHDEIGLGVPKSEAEIARIASQRLAANKAVKIAMNLLGDRCSEDVIAAQGRDFFAGMSMTAMDNTIRRIAETEALYNDEAPAMAPATVAEPAMSPAPACAPVATPVATPTAGMPISDDPKCEEKVEEVKAPDFTTDEKAEIEKEASRIASARKAKIIEAVNKRANELMADAPAVPAPEVAPAPAPAPEVAPAPAPAVADETDSAEFGLGQEVGGEQGDPELTKLFDNETTEMTEPTASRTASAKFSGTLPRASLDATASSEDLSSMWTDSEL
jgi:hypothetical protein